MWLCVTTYTGDIPDRPRKELCVTFSIEELNDEQSYLLSPEIRDWDKLTSVEPDEDSDEIPEYFRVKIPTKDDFMTIATIYNGQEDEHIERHESTVRWLTDKSGEAYKFTSKEEARVFLALNVDPAFIRPTDRAQSIEAYGIRQV
jgi:hypothetical protein